MSDIRKPYTGKNNIVVDGQCYYFVEHRPGELIDGGLIDASFDSCAECQETDVIPLVLISEVSPFLSSFTLINPTSQSVDISEFWVCSDGTYVSLGDFIQSSSSSSSGVFIMGNTVIDPEDTLAITISGFLNFDFGNLSVFRNRDFFDAGSLMDFVQWGDTGLDGEDIASYKPT